MQRPTTVSNSAQEITLSETAVAVLGKGRMIGNVAVEPPAAKSAIGQIEVNLVAQSPFGENVEAVAYMSVRTISSGSIEGRPMSL
jgi:hypothetical protein